MALPRPLTKEVFIRLDGGDAFVSTVKYGCVYSKAREFKVDWEATLPPPQETPLQPKYLVPPITVALKKRGGV